MVMDTLNSYEKLKTCSIVVYFQTDESSIKKVCDYLIQTLFS
jgi:hypothetical protein